MTRAAGLGTTGSYDGLIVDLDGVMWLDGEPIEGSAAAIERVRARGTRVLFLTNDPQSARAEQAARLRGIGVPADPADVLTSNAATARYLASQPDYRHRRTLVLGAPALHHEVEAAGLHAIPAAQARRAEVVVIGGYEGFDYADLSAATTAIWNGAAPFATGRDPSLPTPDGPRPATGAILAAVETAAGVTATVIGKPEPYVFEIARETLTGCEHLAVVGDRLDTDIAGAKRAGLDAILVLSGSTTEADLGPAEVQPDVVLPSLAAL